MVKHKAQYLEASGAQMWQKQQRRPTIGLLVTWLRDGYENGFMLGVADAAAAYDVNLICLVGGEVRWLVPQNAIFDLVGPEKFDGLIISGTLGHALPLEDLQAFCARFAPLPLVGGALPVPGMVQILPDSGSGMREAVEHLITVHNSRRIAFIQGPEGQTEAEERFQAYVEVLTRHGVTVDPALIAAGDYRRVTGQAAMETLLARGVPFDAVVSANDDMAIGAFEVLQAHGLRVPEDIALVGFDDVEAVRHLTTPLTTVRQSFTAAARVATETLLALIRGEEVPDIVYIPTELVVRRSCGCQLAAVTQAAIPLLPLLETPVTAEPVRPANVPAPLWEAFHEALATGDTSLFLAACERTLRQLQPRADALTAAHLEDIAIWEAILSSLRQAVVPYLTERLQLLQAENLLQQGRVLVNATLQRLEGGWRLLRQRQETAIQEFDRAIAGALTLAELQAPVTQYFPALGIDHAYLALYATENGSRAEACLRLSFERARGAQLWDDGGLKFPSRQLLPPGMLLEQQRYTAVLTSLVMRETQLGFMLFELGVREGAVYDRLSEQFSGNLLRMLLLEEQAAARAALDEARQRAETALRDLMALQQRYVREVWSTYVRQVSGYTATAEGVVSSATAWLPVMTEALTTGQPVQQPRSEGGYSLGLPLLLYGELIGVLGLERSDATPWSPKQVELAQGVLEQAARALEIQRLVAESQHRAAQLQTATEVAQITSSILTLEELLTQAVTLLQERFGYYYVGLFLVDDSGRWAVLRAGTGEAGRIMLERGHKLEIGGDSMIGRCVSENQARIALDVGAEAVRFDNPLLPETRSEMALPLRSRGRAIGAMSIQSAARAAFSAEDIAVLQTVADQLGNAIENARLLDEMEQTVQALEAAQGTYTRESWRAYLEMVGRTLAYRYRMGLEPLAEVYPEVQQALEEQRPVITQYTPPEAEATATPRATVAIPVRLREQTIGALNLRFEGAHVPTETLTLVEQVAEQLALSLESARLYQATQQQAAQERLISEVTAHLRESLDLERILQTAVLELGKVAGAVRVDVQLGTDED